MASKLDRSNREKDIERQKTHKEKEDRRRAKAEEKARNTAAVAPKKVKPEKRRNAASYEVRVSIRTMVYSSLIIIIAFVVIELCLYASSGGWGDINLHLLNIADNTFAFIVGLSAMDALGYLNQVQRRRRNEIRAIIRHNRILEPSIEMFTVRKNILVTSPGKAVDQYATITDFDIWDMSDMYNPSTVPSDAGRSKIDMFSFHLKKVNNAMLKIVEDIDFAFDPDICDAVMKFISATTYGSSALDSLVSYGNTGSSMKKAAIVAMIKEAPRNGTLTDADSNELKSVYILMQMIRDQEDALKTYSAYIADILEKDPDNRKRTARV